MIQRSFAWLLEYWQWHLALAVLFALTLATVYFVHDVRARMVEVEKFVQSRGEVAPEDVLKNNIDQTKLLLQEHEEDTTRILEKIAQNQQAILRCLSAPLPCAPSDRGGP